MTPGDQLRLIAEEASGLAETMPRSVVETLAQALAAATDSGGSVDKSKIVAGIAHARYRNLAADLLDRWKSEAPNVRPQTIAAALLTASRAEERHREGATVELVWTGPDVGFVPLRRTEQAILQVIDSAAERLLVISYAVFNVPRICEALVRAADRGVSIALVVESPDRIEGQKAYSTLAALGPTVASRCGVYLWPIESRFKGGSGKPGILHVKCAVADGRWLFLSSANLTEQAFSINMELGVLITGGRQPSQVADHFGRMIEAGILVRA